MIRDVTDIDHPSTLTAVNIPPWWGDGWESPSFVSGSTISYVSKDPHGIVQTAVSGTETQIVELGCQTGGIVAFRWSSDGQALTYAVADRELAGLFRWHFVSGGIDREIGTAPIWCFCGERSDDDSFVVAFSPSGQSVSLVDYVGKGTDLQVRRLDGSLIGSEIRGDNWPSPVTMAVWSGTDLYFRDSAGVERFHAGAVTPFLPGVAWVHPWASPNGGQIVYSVRGSDGFNHVFIADTSTGQTRQLSNQPRTWPVFLSSRYIWYRGERLCTPSDGICRKTTFDGTSYIYDLQTSSESGSIITDIADVWPHAA